MITEKFQYVTLSRNSGPEGRIYITPDNEKLVSVTTILDATKSEKSRQTLANWRRRTGAERAQQITTEAANRGTKMHTFLEHYIRDGVIRTIPDNPFHHPSWHMAQSVISRGLQQCSEFWGIEVPLYFPRIYAGTTDCVGIHQDTASIIDFKQTNKPKKREWIDDYFTQICAYAAAHNELYGTTIRRGVIMMCVKPEVTDAGRIVSNPEYQEFILEGTDFDHYENMWWKRVEQYYMSL